MVLVGHGTPAEGCDRALVAELKGLEGARRARGAAVPTPRERELDARVRGWPRDRARDPYVRGCEALAAALAAALGVEVHVAYNELCGPSIEEAVDALVAAGHTRVDVVPTMVTPGGVHAEVEVPEALAALAARHPEVTLRYAWPFRAEDVAALLAARVAALDAG